MSTSVVVSPPDLVSFSGFIQTRTQAQMELAKKILNWGKNLVPAGGEDRRLDADTVTTEQFQHAMKDIMAHNEARNDLLQGQWDVLLDISRASFSLYQMVAGFHFNFELFPATLPQMQFIGGQIDAFMKDFNIHYKQSFQNFREKCKRHLERYLRKSVNLYKKQQASHKQALIDYNLGYSYADLRTKINAVMQEMDMLEARLDRLHELLRPGSGDACHQKRHCGIWDIYKLYFDSHLKLTNWCADHGCAAPGEQKSRAQMLEESKQRKQLGVRIFDDVNLIRRNVDQVNFHIIASILKGSRDKQRDDHLVQQQLDIQIREMLPEHGKVYRDFVKNLRTYDTSLLVRVVEAAENTLHFQEIRKYLKDNHNGIKWRTEEERSATFDELNWNEFYRYYGLQPTGLAQKKLQEEAANFEKYTAEYIKKIEDGKFKDLTPSQYEKLSPVKKNAYYQQWQNWWSGLSEDKQNEINESRKKHMEAYQKKLNKEFEAWKSKLTEESQSIDPQVLMVEFQQEKARGA